MRILTLRSAPHTHNRGEWPLLIGIVVLACAARLIYGALIQSWAFSSQSDFCACGYELGQIAASPALGDGFSWPQANPLQDIYSPGRPTAWMPPLYPFLIAAAFKIFGVFSEQAAIALELFQTIVSALTCVG